MTSCIFFFLLAQNFYLIFDIQILMQIALSYQVIMCRALHFLNILFMYMSKGLFPTSSHALVKQKLYIVVWISVCSSHRVHPFIIMHFHVWCSDGKPLTLFGHFGQHCQNRLSGVALQYSLLFIQREFEYALSDYVIGSLWMALTEQVIWSGNVIIVCYLYSQIEYAPPVSHIPFRPMCFLVYI